LLTSSCSISKAIKFLSNSIATFPTIPLPKNGSNTIPFLGQKHLINIFINSLGFAGILPQCGLLK
jgi:hypothetical protein